MQTTSAQVTQKTRTYDYHVAQMDVAAAMTMNGLDYMREVVAGRIGGRPSMIDTINITVPPVLDFGKAMVEAEAGDFLLNPMGTVHGGFAATLLDTVLGMSVMTSLPEATGFTTMELKINYIRPILPGGGRLRAEGNLIHGGRQMATAEGRLVGVDDGKLYAHGSTTCMVFPLRARADAQ